jgi:VWFA-related protein
MRLSAGLAAASIAWGAGLTAQQPGSVRETAEVTLVEVAVRVTGKDGRPIRDLKASDFTLSDDGRKQEIVGFDAIDLAEKVPPEAQAPIPPAARRRFLILFDFSFARPKAVMAARRAAREFVLRGLTDDDLCAVATFSVEKGLRMLVTFSSDRAQLARSVEGLGLETGRERSDPLSFAFDTTLLKTPPPMSIGGGSASTSAESDRAPTTFDMTDYADQLSGLWQARDDDYERGRARTLIQSFRDLGRALDAVEGRKDIIYLSEGFRNRLVTGTDDTEEEKQWLLHGEVWKIDSDKRYGSSPLRVDIDEMGELLRRTDCVIHAVDISGIEDSDLGASSGGPIGRRESQDSLFALAHPTGGDVFRNANDLSEQFGALMVRTSLTYVLAFRPDRWGHEGRFHELKVKVAAPGARVAARRGYFERRGFKTLSPLERSLSAANVIASEIPVSDIPTRVLAAPFAGSGQVATVPVLVEIPGPALLAGDRRERSGLEIYVYANDANNRLVDYFVQTLGVDLAAGRERLQAGGMRYFGILELPPGDYRLRSLVRNAETGRMGFQVRSVHVPDFSRREPYVLAPVFLEHPGSWVTVRGHGAGEDNGSGEPAARLFAGLAGENAVPSAIPTLVPGAASRLCLVAYHFGAGESGEQFKLGAQLLDSAGRPLSGGELEVLGRSPAEADGRRVFLLSFKPPQGLTPGRYGLRIFLQDAATGQARQASAPFTVS